MRRVLSIVACVAVLSATASAHFVFVVPDAVHARVQVLLSETLKPDAEVDVSLVAATKLWLRGLDGRETPLALTKATHAFDVALPPAARGVVHGLTDLGVTTRPGAPAHLLRYHPKTIVGDPFDPKTRLGEVPTELVPVRTDGGFRLLLLARGKPMAHAEITVIGPDGSEGAVRTDIDGLTGTFQERGRYGAWARFWESTPGEQNGRRYDEVRHYATLVFDVPAAASSSAAPVPAPTRASRWATLPEATASFGAVAADGWLYVYGGHVSPTHNYSTAAVSGRFNRLRLSDGRTWEALPAGPALQGMNLASYRGLVYRVGGMQPRNGPGEPEDNWSVADVARFDPSTRQWSPLLPLPAPRSSHDVVVSGSKLFVVGGWNMKGKGAKTEWPETMHVLDLASPSPAWTNLPQPFKRRAFIATTDGSRIYVLGGFDDRNRVVRGMDIYDVASGSWSAGPALPGGAMNGFGPAAAVVDGRVVVSIDDGSLHRLSADRSAWEPLGQASPRIVHRLIPDDGRLLIVGGAKAGTNLDLVEALLLR